MRLLPNGIAVLDNDIISKWVEESSKLDHDQNALPQILPFIKPGMTVFDIGAHIGSHTVAYAKAVGENGKIYAFEPSLEAFQCLQANLRCFPQVSSYNMALGAVPGVLSVSTDESNAGSNHVLSLNGTIPLATIDRMDKSPSFIKMDCEGYEPFILIGASATIWLHHPTIVCEVNEGALNRYGFTGKALLAILDAYGYQWRNIYAEQACEGPQYDIIATPK